jgi:hypothetical protein
MLWFQVGWAVSSNARRTYCGRTSTSKLLAFTSFAEASNQVRAIAKHRPHHRFYLVYQLEDERRVVSTLDDIQRLDAGSQMTVHATAGIPDDAFHRFAGRVGKVVAANALELLRILRQDGDAAARARFSHATYDRLRSTLQQEGLLGVGGAGANGDAAALVA